MFVADRHFGICRVNRGESHHAVVDISESFFLDSGRGYSVLDMMERRATVFSDLLFYEYVLDRENKSVIWVAGNCLTPVGST